MLFVDCAFPSWSRIRRFIYRPIHMSSAALEVFKVTYLFFAASSSTSFQCRFFCTQLIIIVSCFAVNLWSITVVLFLSARQTRLNEQKANSTKTIDSLGPILGTKNRDKIRSKNITENQIESEAHHHSPNISTESIQLQTNTKIQRD